MDTQREPETARVMVVLGVVVMCVFCSAASGQPWDGNGVEGDPYLIYTAEDMQAIGADPNFWDAHFKLMADIDIGGYTGTSFNIIGRYWPTRFTGVFDGNGRTISNFTYDSNGTDYIGLFGYVSDVNAEIKNLGLIDPNVDAGTGYEVGSLVGYLNNGTITDCNSIGGSVSGYYRVGGLVGNNSGGTVSDSYATGSVSGWRVVGGLAGRNYGTIVNCYATGDVNGSSYDGSSVGGLVGENLGYGTIVVNCYATGSVSAVSGVGGLVGDNSGGGTVSNSYSTASVSGINSIGGLVGFNGTVGNGTVSNSYAVGDVNGTGDYVGGLVGYNGDYGTVNNSYAAGSVSAAGVVGGLLGESSGYVISCFWDVNSSGQTSSAGGTGKTTAEMKMAATYAGWGCGPWTIDEGNDYPHLEWENAPGTLITDVLSYAGGSGDANDPYRIETAEQLNSIGLGTCNWGDKHFKLIADINLSDFNGTEFNIIGTTVNPFTGVFDGNGHTISNFTYGSTGINYIGLFGFVDDPNAEIKNLGLIDPHVDAGTAHCVGSLVGFLNNGTITDCNSVGGHVNGFSGVGGLAGVNGGTVSNCFAWGEVNGRIGVGGLVGSNNGPLDNCYAMGSVWGGGSVGGLVGNNSDPISNCFATGSVWGEGHVGGLVGWNKNTVSKSYATGNVTDDSSYYSYLGGLVGQNEGIISECYATGNATASGNYVGGLVGFNNDYRGGELSNCYSEGNVTGDSDVGGLVGYFYSGTASSCYSIGSVTGNTDVGGLVGYFDSGTASNCYSKGNVTGDGDVGGLVGYFDSGTASFCYSIGSVTGNTDVGGLVGFKYSGKVFNSLWDTDTSGQATSDGGRGRTTAQMQTESTFIGWDCNPVWTIDEGIDYPHLEWENAPGTLIDNVPFPTGGSGDANDPYRIETAEQLNSIGLGTCNWDKHFKLIADINLSDFNGTEFNVSGTPGIAFTGVFDGNGHTISNFTYSSTGTDYIGLFGYVNDVNAEIKNLDLIDPNVDAGTADYVGSLVGYLGYGTITDCNSVGGSVSGDSYVGGLVGYAWNVTVSNCYTTGSVSGDRWVGGLLGYFDYGTVSDSYATGSVSGRGDVGGLVGHTHHVTVSNCYATGSVSGTSSLVGGLVGYFRYDTVSNCYATGSVSGTSYYVGGLAGRNYYGTLNNSYATASVSGDNYVGGLVGEIWAGTASNSYATGDVNGVTNVGGLVGRTFYGSCTVSNSYAAGDVNGVTNVGGLVGFDGTYNHTKSFWDNTVNPDVNGLGNRTDANVIGESTANMQMASTFTDAGWDFVDIWDICEGTNYPKLVWSIPVADFVCPDGVNFFDFAVFGLAWMSTPLDINWNPDCDISDPNDDIINGLDLDIFIGNWLTGMTF